MRALARQVERLLSDNRSTAEAGCQQADLGREHLTPAALQDAQDGLRAQLLWVEGRLRKVQGRAQRRDEMLARRYARKPALKDLRKEHTALLRRRERVLEAQRTVLRQIGDAHAWMALEQDPRILVPLFAERKHRLPDGIGLAGPVDLARRAHASGKFLVIENDLTRCLGIGDLTIVFAQGHSGPPLSVEVKTQSHGGNAMNVHLVTVHSGGAHTSLHDEICRVLGLEDLATGETPPDSAKQTEELVSRTELLLAATEKSYPRLKGPSRHVWRRVGNVIARGYAEGSCVDLIERGVIVFASRATEGRLAPDTEAGLRDRFEEIGSPREYVQLSSADFLKNDAWSARVLPVALWPNVPSVARAALMSGDLLFACVMRKSVWVDAMRAEGLELIDSRGWELTGPAGSVHLDVIEVQKLALGVAFGGVSPQEIAGRIASSLRGGKEAGHP